MTEFLSPKLGKFETDLPFSLLVKAGGLAFVTGQGPIDWNTGGVVKGDVKVQTEQSLANIKRILNVGGLSLKQVIKTTVYLTDMRDFDAMNEAYLKHFSGNLPVRATVGVAELWGGIKVEIEAVATLEAL